MYTFKSQDLPQGHKSLFDLFTYVINNMFGRQLQKGKERNYKAKAKGRQGRCACVSLKGS